MTARDRIVIVIVLVAAAVVGSWLLVIQPKRDQAARLGTQLANLQSQLDSAQAKLNQARSAQNAFQNESAQLAALGEAVPAGADIPSLIYQLQNAADGARVDFRGLQTSALGSTSAGGPAAAAQSTNLPPNVTVGANGFPTQAFTFTFTGTYFQLAKFIDHVQHFVSVKGEQVNVRGRLLALNSISLAAGPTGFPKITATISANAYLMPTSQTPATGTPTTPSTTSSTPTASAPSSSSSPASPAVATPIR